MFSLSSKCKVLQTLENGPGRERRPLNTKGYITMKNNMEFQSCLAVRPRRVNLFTVLLDVGKGPSNNKHPGALSYAWLEKFWENDEPLKQSALWNDELSRLLPVRLHENVPRQLRHWSISEGSRGPLWSTWDTRKGSQRPCPTQFWLWEWKFKGQPPQPSAWPPTSTPSLCFPKSFYSVNKDGG